MELSRDFPGGSVVKNPPATAGDTRASGLIPVSGRSPEEGMATLSSILVWEIPWTERSPVGHKESDTARMVK